jgi:hypothetical protein
MIAYKQLLWKMIAKLFVNEYKLMIVNEKKKTHQIWLNACNQHRSTTAYSYILWTINVLLVILHKFMCASYTDNKRSNYTLELRARKDTYTTPLYNRYLLFSKEEKKTETMKINFHIFLTSLSFISKYRWSLSFSLALVFLYV